MKINAIGNLGYSKMGASSLKRNARQNVNFEGKSDKIAKTATTAMSGVVGGVLGFLIAGPVGAAIGGSLGAGAGSIAQDTENDSMNSGDYSSFFDQEDERTKF